MRGYPGSGPQPPQRKRHGPKPRRKAKQQIERPLRKDAYRPKDDLAAQNLASVVWEPWQDTWYMELNVECLMKKLWAFSGGYSSSPYCRIAKLGLHKLIEIIKALGGPAKVNVYVAKSGTAACIPGEEFVMLAVMEKDRCFGEFVVPLALFLGCSRTIVFSFRRH